MSTLDGYLMPNPVYINIMSKKSVSPSGERTFSFVLALLFTHSWRENRWIHAFFQ